MDGIRDYLTFSFDGTNYEVPVAATYNGGDAILLPDKGIYLELNLKESIPPKVLSVTVIGGPYNVPDRTQEGGYYIGQTWTATIVNN